MNYSYPQSGNRCAKCNQLRYSVDAIGICGPCPPGEEIQRRERVQQERATGENNLKMTP